MESYGKFRSHSFRTQTTCQASWMLQRPPSLQELSWLSQRWTSNQAELLAARAFAALRPLTVGSKLALLSSRHLANEPMSTPKQSTSCCAMHLRRWRVIESSCSPMSATQNPEMPSRESAPRKKVFCAVTWSCAMDSSETRSCTASPLPNGRQSRPLCMQKFAWPNGSVKRTLTLGVRRPHEVPR